jgi:hypothetical protein
MGSAQIFFENFSVNSLKRDLLNDTTFNQPLFSLVNTYKKDFKNAQIKTIWQTKLRYVLP